jgi:hypothetical protein
MSISNLFTSSSKPWQNLNVNSLNADNELIIPTLDTLPTPENGKIISLKTGLTTNELYYSDGINWIKISNQEIPSDLNINSIIVNDLNVNNNLVIPTLDILPTPENGKIISLKTGLTTNELYYSDGLNWYKVSNQNANTPMYTGTSNGTLITATTAQISLLPLSFVGTLSIPANMFKKGDAYHFVMAGTFGAQNNDTLTLRGIINGNPYLNQVIPLTGVSGQHFEIEIDYVIREIGGVGVASIALNWDFTYSDNATSRNFYGDRLTITNNTTFNTTIINTWDITAQFNSANANNSIQTLLTYMSKINA